jgi:hypothetical protein
MPVRALRLLFICTLASPVAACGGDGQQGGNSGGSGGAGLTGLGGLGGPGGNTFNECGVAAPLPTDTGHCTAVSAPAVVDFDDYTAGTAASSYTYYVNGKPPAGDAVLGAFLHIDDGSGTNGTSVVSTEMVTGEGNAGYAVQISDSNAVNWGGILLFYFPSNGTSTTCLNAQSYSGVEFSVKGSSPSGRIGVSLGMLDTIAITDKGLCDNATATDCKNASIERSLSPDAATWAHVQVPWSAFTPGVGSGRACVPVTGQNVVQLAIQPFMSYPPPNYMLAPGPYAIAVDNVRFY